MTSDLDPGSSLFFTLTIDGEDLGSFNGCEGLSSEVEMEHYQEGATTDSSGTCPPASPSPRSG